MGCRINVLHSQTTLENDERYILAGVSLYTGCPMYRSARRTRVNRGQREREGKGKQENVVERHTWGATRARANGSNRPSES